MIDDWMIRIVEELQYRGIIREHLTLDEIRGFFEVVYFEDWKKLRLWKGGWDE